MGTVRLGMVGLGGWGRFVAQNFARTPHCELAYICDANPITLREQRGHYRQAKATLDYDDILDDPDVQAVAIVTPAPFHYEMAKAALLADKHVYVEKPLTLSAEHAAALVELAERRNRKLMVGHLLEYHPAAELMKQKIDDGELGEIYYMYCQRVNLGVVRNHEDAFWSLAPHDISVILYLFEAEPDHIVTSGQSFLQEDIEDVVFANLHFPDGRIANIHVSWLDPHKRRQMVLVGSEKMLVFDDMAPSEKIRIYDKGALVGNGSDGAISSITVRHGDIHIPHISNRQPLAVETEHFIESIRNDTQPRSDGYDGLRVVRILEEVDRQLSRARPTILPKVKAA